MYRDCQCVTTEVTSVNDRASYIQKRVCSEVFLDNGIDIGDGKKESYGSTVFLSLTTTLPT